MDALCSTLAFTDTNNNQINAIELPLQLGVRVCVRGPGLSILCMRSHIFSFRKWWSPIFILSYCSISFGHELNVSVRKSFKMHFLFAALILIHTNTHFNTCHCGRKMYILFLERKGKSYSQPNWQEQFRISFPLKTHRIFIRDHCQTNGISILVFVSGFALILILSIR